jgi:MFS family permease
MLKINKVVLTLITSDFLLQSGWGMIAPIFAIFITKQIQGGTLAIIGLIAATYWFTKSVMQPFIANFFDKNIGEKDDFKFLVLGMYVANLVPLGYAFSSQLWQIFLLEFIRGIAMAFVIPSWSAIFTRHIDKGREAFSWSIESTGIGFAAAFAGAVGGLLVTTFGFRTVFVLVSIFGMISSSVLLSIRKKVFTRDHYERSIPVIEKPSI